MNNKKWTKEEIENVLNNNTCQGRSKQAIYMLKWKYGKWQKDNNNTVVDDKLKSIFHDISHKNGNPPSQDVTIDDAIETLKYAIVQFIDIEVKKLSEDRIKKLKDEYEIKLQDMQKVMIEAKNSSIIGMLKQKWGQL